MVIFQTSREGSALFSDVVPVPRAVEFKMATRCKFLSLAASGRLSLKGGTGNRGTGNRGTGNIGESLKGGISGNL